MDRRRKRRNVRYRGPGRRRRRNRKGMEALSTIILVVASCVFVFAACRLVMMLASYYKGGQVYKEVKELAITTIENENGEEDFQINFGALINQNPDTVAWLRFDEPSIINYPVVKSKDNKEYLTKTFVEGDNKLGTIFMDMHNSTIFSDRNTLIYGHHLRVGGEMFSELNKYADEKFCKKHPYFYVYTPDGKMGTYQVFCAGIVGDMADNYRINFSTDRDFVNYLKICKESSNYDVDVVLDANSKIVTLSTCTNENDRERFIVQGVLIPQE